MCVQISDKLGTNCPRKFSIVTLGLCRPRSGRQRIKLVLKSNLVKLDKFKFQTITSQYILDHSRIFFWNMMIVTRLMSNHSKAKAVRYFCMKLAIVLREAKLTHEIHSVSHSAAYVAHRIL